MWTLDVLPPSQGEFLLNHFVPVLTIDEVPQADMMPTLNTNANARTSSEGLSVTATDEVMILETRPPEIQIISENSKKSDPEAISRMKPPNTGLDHAIQIRTEFQPAECKADFDSSMLNPNEHNIVDLLQVNNKRRCIHDGRDFDHPVWKSLPLKYLAREMSQRHIFDCIPNGDKSYARIVYRNRHNQTIQDGKVKEDFEYIDDTGASEKMTALLLAYSIDNTGLMAPLGRNLSFENGIWYDTNNKKKTALEPQPQKENSIVFRLVYHWKKAEYQFRRRTIEVFEAPSNFKHLVGLAYVEYKGNIFYHAKLRGHYSLRMY